MSITNEFASKNKNVDEVIDTVLQAQRDNGIEVHMREALFDPVTSARINKFQRARLEAKGVDLTPYGVHSCNGCGKCNDKKKNESNIARGIFVYSEDDLIDDSDEEYVCEYCMRIGYDDKYRPEECDVCDQCEECREYQNGECDGCKYSPIYNGSTYGEVIYGESAELNPEDSHLIEESQQFDDRIHYPTGHFSVLNYD